MEGEKTDALTPQAVDPTKMRFRSVFIALCADSKRYPGGITALARLEGRNPTVVSDQINPDNFQKSPPTLGTFLELVENGQARRTIQALNYMVGMGAFEFPAEERNQRDAMHHFLDLSARCSDAIGAAATALEDGRLNAEERESLRLMLDALISVAASFRSTL